MLEGLDSDTDEHERATSKHEQEAKRRNRAEHQERTDRYEDPPRAREQLQHLITPAAQWKGLPGLDGAHVLEYRRVFRVGRRVKACGISNDAARTLCS